MKFKRLTSRAEVQALIQAHNQHSDSVVIDVETTSKEPRKARLLDIQLELPVACSSEQEESVVMFGAEFSPLLQELSPNITLIAQGYRYDAHVLYRHGVDLLDRLWRDTWLLGHLADENRESYSLDSYVQEYWDDPYKEEFWAKFQNYQDAPEEEKLKYACSDIVYTRRLYRRLLEKLEADQIPASLQAHVHRLQAPLLRTEIAGVCVDKTYLIDLGVKLKAELVTLEPEMRKLAQEEIEILELEEWQKELAKYKTEKKRRSIPRPAFNFGSPPQLASLLYGRLGLPPQKNEKTRSISTDYASLSKIQTLHPIVERIQRHRDLSKVVGTYIDGTLDRIEDERIYPEFRVAGTVTGRISHSNPNLGQLPKSGGVRGIYCAAPNCVLISADYSQLEVCLEANVTGDPQLARIFEGGLSKHDITSAELKIDRDPAKTLNFALQYWASHYKVAKLLGVSEHEGKRIWDSYWSLYQGPKTLKARTDRMVDAGQPLVTSFGRRRRFPVRRRSHWDADYRQAYNFLIQGTGADITSRAFYLVSEELSQRGWGRGLFTVHDEILIEVWEQFAEEAEKLMLALMVRVGEELGLKIPLKAESSGTMKRWMD